MTGLNRKDDALWRTAARSDEIAKVLIIDARMDRLAAEQKILARERFDLTNRCCQRTRGRRIQAGRRALQSTSTGSGDV